MRTALFKVILSIGCPKTSVRSYHHSLCDNPEECSSTLRLFLAEKKKVVNFISELSELRLLYLGIEILVVTLRFISTDHHFVINVSRNRNVWTMQVTFIITQNLIRKPCTYICFPNMDSI